MGGPAPSHLTRQFSKLDRKLRVPRELTSLVLRLLICILLGYGLGILYHQLSLLGQTSWLTIATLHSCLAVLLLIYLPSIRLGLSLRKFRFLYLSPGILIVLGSISLAGISCFVSAACKGFSPLELLSFQTISSVVWIPIVEELIYRGALNPYLKARGSWGGYLGAIVFALAHTLPHGNPLLLPAPPLGVFFLALICDFLYQKTASLWSSIAFHMACNATVSIFLVLDPRWLQYLRPLYLQGVP